MSLDDEPPVKASGKKATPARSRKRDAKERDMGDALRSVYDRTVQEEVPDEFLDLLSKLD